MKNKDKNKDNIIKKNLPLIIPLTTLAIAFMILFGSKGLRFFFGAGIVFVFPVFMILKNLDISVGERVLFSLMLGLGIIPSIVYLSGFFLGSIITAVVIAVILIGAAGMILSRKRR